MRATPIFRPSVLTRSRLIALSVALAVGLAALPAAAAAAVSPIYAVRGLELPSTPTQATFAGVASGSFGDHGLWKAVVIHDTITPGVIDGGAFSMTTNDGTKVTGAFVGGSIIPTSGSDCSRTETFDVSGVLGDVDSSDGTYFNDSGSFVATLTHYRILWRTTCITFAATVTGTVTFT